MVQLNFDANQVAPNTGMQAVPAGWYNVTIAESEIKPTKDNAGAYLQLKCPIIDGEHAGKPIFIRLNIQNQNQQAVDIAYSELSSICHCINVFQIADTSQMHGIPFQVKVIVRPAEDGYDESNDVKAYRDAAGNEPGKAPAQGGAPTQFSGTSATQQTEQTSAFGGTSAGQQQPQGGWGGNAPTQADPNAGQPPQPAQQEAAPAGNAGWTQSAPAQQGDQSAQGGAPWGANQG